MNRIRAAVTRLPGVRMWRNNTGALYDETGRLVAYGLAKGSADLVGIVDGRFVALEVKKPGERAEPDQELWLGQVNQVRGVGVVVYSPEEACEAIAMARQW